jgi:hypothetical protein
MPNSTKTVARRALFALLVAISVLIGGGVVSSKLASATTGINQKINFQGRLLTSQGATVPDGHYNIQFKIYQDGDGQTAGDTTGSPAGSLKWTEEYLNANSQGVLVKNGYMSVELGSVNPFGSSIDWNQDTLWLSINIGNTNASCTPFTSCSPDGEMLPMRRFSATAYALNAGKFGGLTADQFVQLAQGVQTEAGNNTSSIYLNKTGTAGSFLQLQSSGTDVFSLTNTGDLLFGANSSHTLSVATSAAGVAGQTLTMSAGTGGSGTGSTGGDLVLQGGGAGGTNGNGGNVTINAGAKTGSGTDGTVAIGASNTSAISLGADTTLASGKNLTVTSGTTSLTGTTNINTTGSASTNIGTGTGNTAIGNATGTLQLSSNTFNLSTAGVITGVTGLSLSSGNFVQNGSGTFSTGTGLVSLNGNTNVASSASFATQAGATYTVAGTSTNAPLNTASYYLLDTSGAAQIIQGITAGRDGQLLTITNIDALGVTLANNSGSATGSKITTGTGGDISIPSGGSINLIYDSANSLWRVVSTSAANSGYANTALSNLASTNINQALNTTAGNLILQTTTSGNIILNPVGTIELQKGTNVTGSLSATTSVLAPTFDTASAGALDIGTTNATQINLNKNVQIAANQNITFAAGTGSFDQSASTGTFKTGSGAVSLNGDTTVASGKNFTVTSGTTSLTGTTNINTTGTAATTIGSATGGAVSITANAASNFTTTTGGLTLQGAGGTTMTTGAGTTSGNVTISTGNASAGASGNISLDAGTATTTAGTISIGTTNASSVTIGRTTGTVTVQGGLTAGASAGTGTFTNNGSTKNATLALGDLAAGAIGTAANTVDKYTSFTIAPTASGRTYTIPAPTDGAAGRVIFISNIHATSTFIIGSTTFNAHSTATLVYDGTSWNFAGMDGGSNNYIQNQFAAAQTGNYWISGTARADTSVLTPTLDTASAVALNVGTTNAASIILGKAAGTAPITLSASTINLGIATSATTLQAATQTTAATAGSQLTIQGATGSTTGAGGVVTIQGGTGGATGANGGNLNLLGGTGTVSGVTGLVVINTPTFSTTANDANCYTGGALVANSCTITSASINGSGAIIVGFSAIGNTATMPDPTLSTAGRVVYITAANGSSDFTLSVNGGGTGNTIAMRQNTTATMIWNGADWTAAGASSSTTLQSAYDNTLQSAGGAELVVSKTSATNGLTIRDSATNSVNGTLLSVQTSSAASLFQVNSNLTEYTSNSGAETYNGAANTFPASTWVALTGSTVSRNTTTANIATGQGSAQVATTTTAGSGVKNVLTGALTAGQHYNVSFSAKLSSGTFTDLGVYYSIDGSADSVTCATNQAIKTSVWTKVNCTFTAPASGITSANSINIRQIGSGTARTFYVDNISVTIAADYNYATDGNVNDNTNFGTNWTLVGTGTITRNTGDGQEASDSAQAAAGTTANNGVKNKLAINPLTSTLYRVSVYTKLVSGTAFTDFKVRYTPDNGTSFVDCVDYNTQTVTTSGWTQVTCYITTSATAVTTPYVQFIQPTAPASARTFLVDAFSMTLAASSTPNVQIGSGSNGGPTTLFTLDKGASAPIAANNDALLGSMYYDTTLGKLQCYEADGWGACGSSPDNIVTISPEYTNAVLHGTGIGTMTSDLCSDALDVNDGTSGQASICGTNETYNFYKWTSPQPTAQTYSIFVTYQLPSTFKSFASGQTSIMGRTDSANSTVSYQIYRNNSSTGLTPCGSSVSISTGVQTTWKIGQASGASDPSTCGFAPGDSIVYKINAIASSNANAYIGNLNFTFSNR